MLSFGSATSLLTRSVILHSQQSNWVEMVTWWTSYLWTRGVRRETIMPLFSLAGAILPYPWSYFSSQRERWKWDVNIVIAIILHSSKLQNATIHIILFNHTATFKEDVIQFILSLWCPQAQIGSLFRFLQYTELNVILFRSSSFDFLWKRQLQSLLDLELGCLAVSV